MKIIVIKWGSFAVPIGRQESRGRGTANKGVVQDVLKLSKSIKPVIVHGGGKEISETLSRAGIKSKFMRGQRVTDKATMEIVEKVLSGKINKAIVGLINAMGGRAVGISGKDRNLIVARKKQSKIPLGFTGVVKEIHPGILSSLLKENIIPIISPVSADTKGKTYNINADSVAGKMAVVLRAESLVFLSNVPGVLVNPQERKSVLPVLKISQIAQLKKEKRISTGMLPKLEAAKEALQGGVKDVYIVDGQAKGVLIKLLAGERVGTRITK